MKYYFKFLITVIVLISQLKNNNNPLADYCQSSSPQQSNYAPGQVYIGGFFNLQLISYDSSKAYYLLYYSYFVQRNLSSYQTCCDSNTIANQAQIGFPYSTPDFLITCESGCKAIDNTNTLGYMGGI